ncbi:MAG: hypothetical protein ABSH51_28050 [Solirubrobacteraceae bacterium]|jgi:hypothetical protein
MPSFLYDTSAGAGAVLVVAAGLVAGWVRHLIHEQEHLDRRTRN